MDRVFNIERSMGNLRSKAFEVDPDVMNSNCNYIYNWDKDRLLELAVR